MKELNSFQIDVSLKNPFTFPEMGPGVLRKLTSEQKKAFQVELRQIAETAAALVRMETKKLSNEDTKDVLESVEGHVTNILAAIGDGGSFQMMLLENASCERDALQLMSFCEALPTVKWLLSEAISKDAYLVKVPKTEIRRGVAKVCRELLLRYNLRPTVTLEGLWARCVQHCIGYCLGSLGVKKESINKYLKNKSIKNDLQAVSKWYKTAEKKEGKLY